MPRAAAGSSFASRLLAWGLAGSVGWAGTALAGDEGPEVVVAATTRIELDRVEVRSGRLLLVGRLLDDRGEPLPGRRLRVVGEAPDDGPQWVETSEGGRFEVSWRVGSDDAVDLGIAFEGERLYLPAERGVSWRPEAPPLLLKIHWPRGRLAPPSQGFLPLEVRVRRGAEPARALVEVRGPSGSLLARGRTAADGTARLRVDLTSLPRPAMHELSVEARVTAPPARVVQRALVALAARPRLVVERHTEPGGERLAVRLEGAGRPLSGRPLGLYRSVGSRREHLGTAWTDAAGRAVFRVLGDGDTPLLVVFEAEPPLLPGATVTVPPEALPEGAGALRGAWWWWWLPLLASGLVALGVTLVRCRGGLVPAAMEDTKDAPGEGTPPPLVPRWRAGRAAGRRASRSIRFQVLDRRRGTPLPGARLRATADSGRQEDARADASGWIRWSSGSPGRWALEIAAPGYLAERYELVLPHRGMWEGATVSLEHVRDALERGLEPLARRLTGMAGPLSWERATFAELRGMAGARVGRDLDGALASAVVELFERAEALRYGPVDPTEAQVDALQRRATVLADRMTPRPPTGRRVGDAPGGSTVAVASADPDNGGDEV